MAECLHRLADKTVGRLLVWLGLLARWLGCRSVYIQCFAWAVTLEHYAKERRDA